MPRSDPSHRAASTSGPGVTGPSGPTFRNASASWARASQPERNRTHEPGWIAPCCVLPRLEVGDGQQVAGVLGALGRLVDDDRRPDEPARLDRGDVLAVLAADPVDRGVEVGPGVLADLQHVPRPGGTGVVVAAEAPPRELRRVRERLGQGDDRRVLAQRLREVDDLHGAVGQGGEQCGGGAGRRGRHAAPRSLVVSRRGTLPAASRRRCRDRPSRRRAAARCRCAPTRRRARGRRRGGR